MNKEKLEEIFHNHGFSNFKWIDPKDIEVSYWVRFKCKFACDYYGERSNCPPNTPPVDKCKQFFREYSKAVIFHIRKTLEGSEEKGDWYKKINSSLRNIEKDVFLQNYPKAIMFPIGDCNLCDSCEADRKKCNHKQKSRPVPDAMAVDLFKTAEKYNFSIRTLSNYDEEMNRYAILMVE